MTMYKTIPTFILLFTGYLRTNMDVAADTSTPSSSSPAPEDTQAPESETPRDESNSISGLFTQAPESETPRDESNSISGLFTQAPESETPRNESNSISEEHLSSLIVAGISMAVVFLFILVIICACYVWKKSKGSLVENNSEPSSEPGVSLKDFQHLKTNASGLLEAHYTDSGRAIA